jgi:hypothetical protein
VAAWFSIAGLMAIFGGAALGVAVMAATLELGKIISVSWLYRNWHAKGLLKYYLILAVAVLMFITSLGIFGFLSRAHIEQSLSSTDNTVRIEQLDDRIVREQSKITDTVAVIAQLDNAVTVLQNNDRISGPNGAVALRLSQEPERAKLNAVIDSANNAIDDLKMQRMPLNQAQIAKEVEVGPLKYVAELIYGKERAQENFDQAVRWVIIILVLVFDPLAVALLVAAGADVNLAPTEDGATPLFAAAQDGHSMVVEALLAKGADVEAEDNVTFGEDECQHRARRACAYRCRFVCV